MSDPRGYDYPRPVDGYDLLKLCIAIPNEPTYRRSFFGHLTYLMHPTTWNQADPDEAELVAEYWTQIIYDILVGITGCDENEAETQEPTPEIVEKIIIDYFIGDSCSLDEFDAECEDNMACLKPVKIGGLWYLPVDCGCNDAIFIPLGDAVAVDANGDPVPLAEGGALKGGFTGSDLVVSSGNVNCYGAKATAYLMERAIEWANAVIDWSVLGADALSGLSDEVIEAALLASNLLFGTTDLDEIETYAKADVANALRNATYQSTLASLWTFTGSPNRNDLRGWIGDAPYFVNSVPVRLILSSWLDYSIVSGYSNALLSLASECESGQSTPDTFPTESELLAGSNDWAHVFDLTVAPLVENVSFAIDEVSGVDVGQYVQGIGYIARPDTIFVPHAKNALRLEFSPSPGTGGQYTEIHVKYKYQHELTASVGGLDHSIRGVDQGSETDFDGIYSETGLTTAASWNITLYCDHQGNTTQASGGQAIIEKLAIAGINTDIFAQLTQ